MKPSIGAVLLCFALTPSIARAASAGTVSAEEKQKWQIPQDVCLEFLKVPLEKGPTLFIGNNPEPNGGGSFVVAPGEALCLGFLKSGSAYEKLMEGGGGGGNPYEIRVVSNKSISVIEQLPDVRANTTFSYGETPVSCDAAACTVGDTHCALALPANPYPGIVQEVRNLSQMDWERFAAGTSMDDMDSFLNPLLIRALWGDPEAAQLLTNPPFQLDAGPGEIWAGAVDVYNSAKRLGCRPHQIRKPR